MAILTFPAGLTTRLQKLYPRENQTASQSPFSGKRSIIRGYSQWVLQFQPTPVRMAEYEKWVAFFIGLREQLNSFRYFPVQAAVSTLTGKTLPFGAFPYSQSITIGGWLPNQVSQLRTGQIFSVRSKLIQIVSAPLTSDLNGRCLVEIAPSAPGGIGAGDAVEFVAPSGIFYIPDIEKVFPPIEPDRIAQFSIIDALQDLNQ